PSRRCCSSGLRWRPPGSARWRGISPTARWSPTTPAVRGAASGQMAPWKPTTEEQAYDLRRLILALGTGPVDISESSGRAVNALALVAGHAEQARTLVAHEPPAAQHLPDRDEV